MGDIIGIILGIAAICVVGLCFYSIVTQPELEICDMDQPMLVVNFDGWGENIDDTSETIFNYFVINYGNTEAKNVVVRCEVTNDNDITISQQLLNIGNVASNSYVYKTSTIKELFSDNDFGMCYVDSADGRFLNLEERINEDAN